MVAVAFIFVQYGGSNEAALWLINQGRKYVEAPRWAALGIVVIMVVFAYNVIGTAIAARTTTGIVTAAQSRALSEARARLSADSARGSV